ncbi:hypothetical protein BaRGS_00023955 [Batillaria attramentaria]|uniref:Uncharacterized protein n=1 Tax=Batillaria attramentaria TaxID=370345 RepID=A0ABD0KC99_9CAEN
MKFVRPFLAILWLSGTIPYHTPVTTEYSASLGDLPDTPREQNDTLTNAGSANSSSSQSSGTEGQEVDNNIVSSQVSNVSLIEASNATEDKPLGDSSNQTVLQGQKARAIGHTIILDDGTKTPSDTANNNQSKAQKDAGNSQKSSPSSSPTGRSGETVTGSTPGMSMSPAADDAHTSDVSLGRSCPAGRFGEGCKEACGHCEGGNSRCHVINGVCMSGCESGWLGIRCKASCGPGTWGDHCYGCGRCLGGDVQCNRTTGHCGKVVNDISDKDE